MRSDIQTALNGSQANGHILDHKNLVLAWLLLQSADATFTINQFNCLKAIAATQGISPDNMLDLQIYGYAKTLALADQTWSGMVNAARTNVLNIPQAITPGQYQQLLNYALLAQAGVISG